MGSTKIIHVLKNDKFDDIFDLFKNTEAKEVIFVFPNGSKFVKQEQYFFAIKREADSSDKRVSIMTADPVIARFASQNSLELIETSKSKKRQASSAYSHSRTGTPDKTVAATPTQGKNNSIDVFPADENLEKETVYNEETETAPVAQLTTTREYTPNRIIKDIFKPEAERPVKIREERTRPFEVAVKRELSKENSVTGDITRVWASRESENGAAISPVRSFRKIKSSGAFKKSPLFFIGGAIVVLLLILYSTLGSAQVTIKPKKQPLNFQIKASASSTTTEVSLDFNRIPGQRFSYKDQESGTFEITGQKEVVQKASGKITIFNKSASPQRLVATTRFKSLGGLIFRIPQTISVPAATRADANLRDGSIESAIYADKAGVEYNIGPETFTIPGFEGTPRANDFYAKSSQPMIGGIIGPSKVVTEEDFTKAQEAVTAKLKEKILQSLKNQAGELKVLDSTVIKFDSPITNAKAGDAAESLQMTTKGTANTLAFRESDALELIKNYISQKSDLELVQKNLTINYLNPQNNADDSLMTFGIQVTGQSAYQLDQDKILKDILGLREDAIRSYFKDNKEIESARIVLSPFWVKNIPKDPSKIKLIIEKE